MEFKKYKDPWEYYEIIDILNEKEFSIAEEYSSLYFAPEKERHRNFVENDKPIYKIFKSVIVNFCKQIEFDTTNKFFLLENSICGPHFKYNSIHQDNENKALTMVFYLSEFNLGTKLFRNKTPESFVKYSNWNQNGAMAFIRKENTFHDFEANETVRRTFNLILLNNKNLDSFIDYKYFCSLI